MTIANEREHLKMVIWIVLDPEGLILDRADGPEHPGSTIVIVETKYVDQALVGMPCPGAQARGAGRRCAGREPETWSPAAARRDGGAAGPPGVPAGDERGERERTKKSPPRPLG